jgi:hypothetical protein
MHLAQLQVKTLKQFCERSQNKIQCQMTNNNHPVLDFDLKGRIWVQATAGALTTPKFLIFLATPQSKE